jgi:hypothetical protein
MAMPASGSIAIISAPQACGSICASVAVASGSLSTLSACAGKLAPHSMLEFYGFAWNAYCLVLTSQTGCGTSTAACSLNTLSKTGMGVQDCFSICVRGSMGTVGQGASSSACLRIYCDTTSVALCTLGANLCCTGIVLGPYVICQTTTFCVVTCGVTTATACVNCSSSCALIVGFINTVGANCILSTCCTACVCTG